MSSWDDIAIAIVFAFLLGIFFPIANAAFHMGHGGWQSCVVGIGTGLLMGVASFLRRVGLL